MIGFNLDFKTELWLSLIGKPDLIVFVWFYATISLFSNLVIQYTNLACQQSNFCLQNLPTPPTRGQYSKDVGFDPGNLSNRYELDDIFGTRTKS